MKRFSDNWLIKFLLVLALTAIFGANAAAQEEPDPAKWSLTIENRTEKLFKDEKLAAVLTARIEKGWHLYALEKVDGGPIPTSIRLAENQPFELGEIVADKPLETADAAFGVTTKFYEDSAKFVLPLRITRDIAEKTKLQIRVRFQICNDEMCLPPKSLIVEAEL